MNIGKTKSGIPIIVIAIARKTTGFGFLACSVPGAILYGVHVATRLHMILNNRNAITIWISPVIDVSQGIRNAKLASSIRTTPIQPTNGKNAKFFARRI